jgi:hypothetical protein
LHGIVDSARTHIALSGAKFHAMCSVQLKIFFGGVNGTGI